MKIHLELEHQLSGCIRSKNKIEEEREMSKGKVLMIFLFGFTVGSFVTHYLVAKEVNAVHEFYMGEKYKLIK